MKANIIFILIIATLIVIGVSISEQNQNANIAKEIENISPQNVILRPENISHNNDCIYKSMDGREYQVSSSFRDKVTHAFFYDKNKNRNTQFDMEKYNDLLFHKFKVLDVGLKSIASINTNSSIHTEQNETNELYNLNVYSRDMTYATKILTDSCHVYYLSNNIPKAFIKYFVVHPDESEMTDDEMLTFFNKSALKLVQFKSLESYDKFKLETSIITEPYEGNQLFALIKKAKNNNDSVINIDINNYEYSKNKNKITTLIAVVDVSDYPNISKYANIYDTNGDLHSYEISKSDKECHPEKDNCKTTLYIKIKREFILSHKNGFELKIEDNFGNNNYTKIITIPSAMANPFANALEGI